MDKTVLMEKLFKVYNLWSPDFFIKQNMVKIMAWKCCEISIWLIVLFFVLEMTRQYKAQASGEGELNFFKPLLKVAIFTVFALSGITYSYAFSTFLIGPAMMLINTVKGSMDITLTSESLFKSMGQNVVASLESGGPMFSSLLKLTPTTFIASLLYHLAIAGLYVISLIQQVYVAILFIIGPILIPTVIFEPWSEIFVGWFRKTLAVLFWAVFGAIILKLIFVAGIFSALAHTVGGNNMINIIILSLAMAVLAWFVPKLSDQIVGAGLDAGLSVQGVANKGIQGAKALKTGGASIVAGAKGSGKG